MTPSTIDLDLGFGTTHHAVRSRALATRAVTPHAGLSMRRRALALLVLGALAASACHRKAIAGADPSPAATEAAVAVTTATAEEADIMQSLPLTGTLLPNRKSEVAADAMGKVMATFVERGTFVTAGAPLARLDRRGAALGEREAVAQAAATRTQSRLAHTECVRSQRLFDAGAINRADYDRSQARCDASSFSDVLADVRLGQARKTFTDGVVRAPFAGQIADRYVTEGEFVRADSRVVSLVDIDTLRLELSVPEGGIAQIAHQQEVDFSVAAFPGETFRGRVRFMGASVRRASRDLLVEAVVSNRARRLRPGMFATASLNLGPRRQTVIPASALRKGTGAAPHGEGADRVLLVANGRIEERLIHLGVRNADRVVVVDGVRPGERVITNPAEGLRDGARIK